MSKLMSYETFFTEVVKNKEEFNLENSKLKPYNRKNLEASFLKIAKILVDIGSFDEASTWLKILGNYGHKKIRKEAQEIILTIDSNKKNLEYISEDVTSGLDKINSKNWKLLGNCFYELEHYNASITCYKQARIFNPEDKTLHNSYALAVCESVITTSPATLTPKRQEDQVVQLQEALAALNHAISIDPNYAKGYYNIAIINRLLHKRLSSNSLNYLYQALEYLNKAIELNEYDKKAYDQKGQVEFNLAHYYLIGNRIDEEKANEFFQESIYSLKKAIDMGVRNLEIYIMIARNYCRLQNYHEAIGWYNLALKINPKEPGALAGKESAGKILKGMKREFDPSYKVVLPELVTKEHKDLEYEDSDEEDNDVFPANSLLIQAYLVEDTPIQAFTSDTDEIDTANTPPIAEVLEQKVFAEFMQQSLTTTTSESPNSLLTHLKDVIEYGYEPINNINQEKQMSKETLDNIKEVTVTEAKLTQDASTQTNPKDILKEIYVSKKPSNSLAPRLVESRCESGKDPEVAIHKKAGGHTSDEDPSKSSADLVTVGISHRFPFEETYPIIPPTKFERKYELILGEEMIKEMKQFGTNYRMAKNSASEAKLGEWQEKKKIAIENMKQESKKFVKKAIEMYSDKEKKLNDLEYYLSAKVLSYQIDYAMPLELLIKYLHPEPDYVHPNRSDLDHMEQTILSALACKLSDLLGDIKSEGSE